MRDRDERDEAGWSETTVLESPFLEAQGSMQESSEPVADRSTGFTSPFAEAESFANEDVRDSALAEVFNELRDEAFDEALAFLAEETEQAVSDRFSGEAPLQMSERLRFGEAQLSPVRFEAEQYLQALETGIGAMDVQSLNEEQLNALLDRFDPTPGELSPAGEEFIGGLIRKAKKVVKSAVRVAGKVAGVVVGPVLQRLRKLVAPLLRRVLSFAIGRLPAPLRPGARLLASKIKLEAEDLDTPEGGVMSPTLETDTPALAEAFDAALAESVYGEVDLEETGETFEADERHEADGRALESLAEARATLMDRIVAGGDNEELGPAVEQFVPALLGALRIGVNLVGRPKVVNFLARYVSKLISRWVGPKLATPLSQAIVDTGLRLVSLEAEQAGFGNEHAGAGAIASVIEDTVRRVSENEEYVFEDEALTELAVAEAFENAVATFFPPRFVRTDLQQAPSLGGAFVGRRLRGLRPYAKYSRVPEITLSSQMADRLPSFGGTTLGAALRASGTRFPLKARVHVYQAAPGSSVARILRDDIGPTVAGRGYVSTADVHPLTSRTAGMLLQEPALGAEVPARYLKTRKRVAVGQRLFRIEPISGADRGTGASSRAAAYRLAPPRAGVAIDRARGRAVVTLGLDEATAQRVSEAIRQGRGTAPLLRAMMDAYARLDGRTSALGPQRESETEGEAFAAFRGLPSGIAPAFRRRLRAWVIPMLARWARDHGEAFARAAADPRPGVTVRISLAGIPGMTAPSSGIASPDLAFRGTPSISIEVIPGMHRR